MESLVLSKISLKSVVGLGRPARGTLVSTMPTCASLGLPGTLKARGNPLLLLLELLDAVLELIALRREAVLLLLGLLVVVLGEALSEELDLAVSLLLHLLLLLRETGVGLLEALRVGGLVLGHLALASLQGLLAGGLVLLELLDLLLALLQLLLPEGELLLAPLQLCLARRQLPLAGV